METAVLKGNSSGPIVPEEALCVLLRVSLSTSFRFSLSLFLFSPQYVPSMRFFACSLRSPLPLSIRIPLSSPFFLTRSLHLVGSDESGGSETEYGIAEEGRPPIEKGREECRARARCCYVCTGRLSERAPTHRRQFFRPGPMSWTQVATTPASSLPSLLLLPLLSLTVLFSSALRCSVLCSLSIMRDSYAYSRKKCFL